MEQEKALTSSEKATPNVPELSKKRQKKLQAALRWKERKKQKKLAAKEARGPVQERVVDMSPEAVALRFDKKASKREKFDMALEDNSTIVIDCEFEDEMTEREKNSLSQQIMYAYGINRKSEFPSTVYLSGLRDITKEKLSKVNGYENWRGFIKTATPYEQIFKKETLVYLTADSPNTIRKLDKSKVYIIGGIVDRNRLKGITYEKAKRQGIETAKLPLDEVVDFGGITRVLTVNQVFELVKKYAASGNWAASTLDILPQRKNATAKPE